MLTDQRAGANVKRLRVARGWTQTQLCERLAFDGVRWRQTIVSKVETGARPLMFSEAMALAGWFGVPLEELGRES